MADVTGGGPKELLTLGHRTVLERVIDEAIRAGADETVIISSAQKPEIAEAVDAWSAGPFREACLRVVNQPAPRGLGDAVLWPETVGDALVLLGDCAYHGGSPLERMARLLYRGIDGCIAVEEAPEEEIGRYGICDVDDMGTIRRVIEKPRPDETSSRWAIAARYCFGARLMAALREWHADYSVEHPVGEFSLTPGFQWAIAQGFELKAVALQPGQARVDCGTPEEYQAARRMGWD